MGGSLRLLDLIVQGLVGRVHAEDGRELPGAASDAAGNSISKFMVVGRAPAIPEASYKTNRFWVVAFLTAESGIPPSNVTSLPAW